VFVYLGINIFRISADYIRGYGYQYALEESQAWLTEKQMEKANA